MGMFEADGPKKVRFTWQEPFTFRLKLRRDKSRRLFFWLALLAIIACVTAGQYLDNPKTLNIWEEAGKALIIWGVLAVGFTWFSRGQKSGKIYVREATINRHRWYIHWFWFSLERRQWAYEDILDCEIIPGRAIGETFSLLAIESEQQWVIAGEKKTVDVIGIPPGVELKPLAEFLKSKGVHVRSGREIPAPYAKKFGKWKLVTVGLLMTVCLVGVTGQIIVRQIEANRIAEMKGQQEAQPTNTQAEPAADPRVPPAAPKPPAFQPQPQPRPNAEPKKTNSVTATKPTVSQSTTKPKSTPVAPAKNGRDLELVGERTGSPFRRVSAKNQPMLGMRYQLGQWFGTQAVMYLTPVYDSGQVDPKKTVFRRDGYAVGGFEVVSSKYITAIRVIFMRQTDDGGLDSSDSYLSEWIGEAPETPGKTITSDGQTVIGIHGRRGTMIDAIGLVVAE